MFLIGLTGGIASGKSVVARRLVELGAVHVDADVLAREVVEPGTPGLDAIAAEFGPNVIASDGSLDRPALGSIVFSDPDARAKLNAITHPAVWRRAKELFDAAAANAIVVYDVPLLVEASNSRPMRFDSILVVEAEPETRIERMVTLRKMQRPDAANRIASQATNSERRAIADTVIDANGTLEHTIEQVDKYWRSLPAH